VIARDALAPSQTLWHHLLLRLGPPITNQKIAY